MVRHAEQAGVLPPKAVFGPAWTALYLQMGAAHYLVMKNAAEPAAKRAAHILYGPQLVLNVFRSILLFGRRAPRAALVEILLLWVAIVLTIVAFARISHMAAAARALSALDDICHGAQCSHLATESIIES